MKFGGRLLAGAELKGDGGGDGGADLVEYGGVLGFVDDDSCFGSGADGFKVDVLEPFGVIEADLVGVLSVGLDGKGLDAESYSHLEGDLDQEITSEGGIFLDDGFKQ